MLRPPTLTALEAPSGTSLMSATLTKLDCIRVTPRIRLPSFFLQRSAWLCLSPTRCPCWCECLWHIEPGLQEAGNAQDVPRQGRDLSLLSAPILQIQC